MHALPTHSSHNQQLLFNQVFRPEIVPGNCTKKLYQEDNLSLNIILIFFQSWGIPHYDQLSNPIIEPFTTECRVTFMRMDGIGIVTQVKITPKYLPLCLDRWMSNGN